MELSWRCKFFAEKKCHCFVRIMSLFFRDIKMLNVELCFDHILQNWVEVYYSFTFTGTRYYQFIVYKRKIQKTILSFWQYFGNHFREVMSFPTATCGTIEVCFKYCRPCSYLSKSTSMWATWFTFQRSVRQVCKLYYAFWFHAIPLIKSCRQ